MRREGQKERGEDGRRGEEGWRREEREVWAGERGEDEKKEEERMDGERRDWRRKGKMRCWAADQDRVLLEALAQSIGQ